MVDSTRSNRIDKKEQLRRLVDLSLTLNSTWDLDSLLQLIIQTAADLLECDAASILLYDEHKPHLFFAAATGTDPQKLARIPVPIEGSLAGTIFRTNRPMILNDVAEDPRHYDRVSQQVNFKTTNLLGVPMRMRDRTIGVLEALNKHEGSFNEEDEQVLLVIASHAAVALHNAQLLQAMQSALDKASQANRLKNNFLALASHELRTPLGIIIGYASFLREDEHQETSEHAQQVLNAAMQMRAVLEDMSNLTLLETDGLTYKPQNLPIQRLLENACEEVQHTADVKNQTLIVAVPFQPLMVNVDIEKTTSAIVNLLNNAIRFSPEGTNITIGALEEKGEVIAWVQDSGIGIPKNELNKIFEEFYQVERPNTRRFGGLGLGLAIARGLIEDQGGKLWAESEGIGKGATFKVRLPAVTS